MRKMIGESMGEQGSINVIEHIMLKNLWEYYIIEDSEDVNPEGYATALVMGFETEVKFSLRKGALLYQVQLMPHCYYC